MSEMKRLPSNTVLPRIAALGLTFVLSQASGDGSELLTFQGKTVADWLAENEPDPSPRTTKALLTMGTNAVPDLAQLLASNQKPLIRRNAAWALAKLGPKAKAAIPELLAALHCPDAEVSYWVSQAFANMKEEAKSAVPDLIRMLRDSNSDKDTVMYVLSWIGPPARDATPDVLRLLPTGPLDIRRRAAMTLECIEPERAADHIAKLAPDIWKSAERPGPCPIPPDGIPPFPPATGRDAELISESAFRFLISQHDCRFPDKCRVFFLATARPGLAVSSPAGGPVLTNLVEPPATLMARFVKDPRVKPISDVQNDGARFKDRDSKAYGCVLCVRETRKEQERAVALTHTYESPSDLHSSTNAYWLFRDSHGWYVADSRLVHRRTSGPWGP